MNFESIFIFNDFVVVWKKGLYFSQLDKRLFGLIPCPFIRFYSKAKHSCSSTNFNKSPIMIPRQVSSKKLVCDGVGARRLLIQT